VTRRASRAYWRWRSRRPGRPRIPDDHIALIRRISSENPQWGEDKIAEELAVKLGVRHSTSGEAHGTNLAEPEAAQLPPGGKPSGATAFRGQESQLGVPS
jgi:hypothetical protein